MAVSVSFQVSSALAVALIISFFEQFLFAFLFHFRDICYRLKLRIVAFDIVFVEIMKLFFVFKWSFFIFLIFCVLFDAINAFPSRKSWKKNLKEKQYQRNDRRCGYGVGFIF